jgi:hypothetical protein
MAQHLRLIPGIAPLRRPTKSASRRLWGLDWGRYLPWQIDELTVRLGTFDEALPFVSERYAEIFGPGDGRFFTEPMSEAKSRFCADADVFLFRVMGKTVGLVLAHPTDWSTYYVRSTALLAPYRARGVLPRFLEHFYGPLREAGVLRVESDSSPGNTPVIRLHVREGFVVTGSSNSERWGALLHFTKFLQEEPEGLFMRQFCSIPIGVAPSSNDNNHKKNRRRS